MGMTERHEDTKYVLKVGELFVNSFSPRSVVLKTSDYEAWALYDRNDGSNEEVPRLLLDAQNQLAMHGFESKIVKKVSVKEFYEDDVMVAVRTDGKLKILDVEDSK